MERISVVRRSAATDWCIEMSPPTGNFSDLILIPVEERYNKTICRNIVQITGNEIGESQWSARSKSGSSKNRGI